MLRFLQQDQLTRVSNILIAPIILLMLFVGLQNRGYDSTNHLSIDTEKGGLNFGRNAIAFTDKGFELPRDEKGFIIEMNFAPEPKPYPSFEIILQIFGNSLKNQLLIGQWANSLVIMNGDDYSHKRREPKLYVPFDDQAGKLTLRIESGPQGTSAYINEVMAAKLSSFILQPPPGNSNRLVLGNNISASNPWYGTLYSLSFHAAGDKGVQYSYAFKAPLGGSVQEQKARGLEILLPPEIPILHKKILLWPNFRAVTRPLLIFDIIINILGFIPLGILLPIYLQSTLLIKRNSSLAISLILVSSLSLFIEISQIWIPSRYSSLLDLILNCSGGLAGIIISQHLYKKPAAS